MCRVNMRSAACFARLAILLFGPRFFGKYGFSSSIGSEATVAETTDMIRRLPATWRACARREPARHAKLPAQIPRPTAAVWAKRDGGGRCPQAL
eukprot:5414998-Pyramimonas_sp.AAC.1